MTERDSLLGTKDTASILGVSTATVRNWVKTSLLVTADEQGRLFERSEVESLRERIAQGKVSRLNKRANKAILQTNFIPTEYHSDSTSEERVRKIWNYILEKDLPKELVLFLLAMNWLLKEGLVRNVSIETMKKRTIHFQNIQIGKELLLWADVLPLDSIDEEDSFLLECPLPREDDVLGLLYQSFQNEGTKSQKGSYYTPKEIVRDIVKDYVKPADKVLDPCCGTGQFLLEFAEVVEDPKQIYGFDIDETAVRIARLNLLVKYADRDFEPYVFHRNTLLEQGEDRNDPLGIGKDISFDVIATNPPWGYHFSEEEKREIKQLYPQIKSMESFSLFLFKCLDLLNKDGFLSFILPESVLNVKVHQDIRKIILETVSIRKICCLGSVFKKIFTPVIRLDLEKKKAPEYKVCVVLPDQEYTCDPLVWGKNTDRIFAIQLDTVTSGILNKAYSKKHITLKDNADWALGIVTGNNGKYVLKEPREGAYPVYKGKEVIPFRLGRASSFLDFRPEEFQQMAPLYKYRAEEKLIYRFISNRLVFAYDDAQQLTLNSANIVIPEIQGYPMKAIAGLFNSSLYQFLFQKKFSSIKVLKSHLEELPLPVLKEEEMASMLHYVDGLLEGKGDMEKLDSFVFSLFSLTREERSYVLNAVK